MMTLLLAAALAQAGDTVLLSPDGSRLATASLDLDDVLGRLDPARAEEVAAHEVGRIDLSDAGRQPMLTADGQIGVVFNGEIYNFKELRLELDLGVA